MSFDSRFILNRIHYNLIYEDRIGLILIAQDTNYYNHVKVAKLLNKAITVKRYALRYILSGDDHRGFYRNFKKSNEGKLREIVSFDQSLQPKQILSKAKINKKLKRRRH